MSTLFPREFSSYFQVSLIQKTYFPRVSSLFPKCTKDSAPYFPGDLAPYFPSEHYSKDPAPYFQRVRSLFPKCTKDSAPYFHGDLASYSEVVSRNLDLYFPSEPCFLFPKSILFPKAPYFPEDSVPYSPDNSAPYFPRSV